jgi:D-glycero-D-manno-heptose 1,7-bisphosphate phosphatase
MLLAAQQLLNLDLSRSWIVGDKMDDLLAGQCASLSGGLHVLTGDGPAHRRSVMEWNPLKFKVVCGDSISDAAPLIDVLGVG